MTKPNKFSTCHSDRLNYKNGKCKECYEWLIDPIAPCPHGDRPKDKQGRCSTCMSRYYWLKRKRGEGDKYGTIRTSRKTLKDIVDPEERKILVRRKSRMKAYNLALEDYDRMLEEQGGVCAICGEPPKEGRDLCVDHDHSCCPESSGSCGKCVRGLVCHGCNTRLGQIESKLLSRSMDYLARFHAGPLGPQKETIKESSTGGKKGDKLARFSLLPPRAMWELAETFGRGAEKYKDPYNWMKGYEWSLSYSAMLRHANQFWYGQERSDDGNHHLACVAWHALTLLESSCLGIGTDDRAYKKVIPISIDDNDNINSIMGIERTKEEILAYMEKYYSKFEGDDAYPIECARKITLGDDNEKP